MDLIKPHVEIAAITRGAKGSVVVNGRTKTFVEAEKVDNVVDTTGAGDFYAAGFMAGLCEGLTLRQCGTMGAITAGKVIEIVGTTLNEEAWNEIELLCNRVRTEQYLF